LSEEIPSIMNLEPTATRMSNNTAARTLAIRELNDSFRRTFVGGAVMITDGVERLPAVDRSALLRAVRAFEAFDSGNDPYREHDFAAVELDGRSYFWKIDYHDLSMEAGSPDPADPAVTCRILTIMCAEEY